jgi:steroid delta-isomerase-like uncharacterized protein
MSARNVETVRKFYEAHNRGDLEALMDFVAEDALTTDRARGLTFHGPEGLKAFKRGLRMAFSDLVATMERIIDAGDTVICQEIAEGTNDGPLGPLPASGRRCHVGVCAVFGFDSGGLIETADFYWDQLTLLTQLGHQAAA